MTAGSSINRYSIRRREPTVGGFEGLVNWDAWGSQLGDARRKARFSLGIGVEPPVFLSIFIRVCFPGEP
jgi:hypothetical protein